jgi:hypothetical protein
MRKAAIECVITYTAYVCALAESLKYDSVTAELTGLGSFSASSLESAGQRI